MLNSRFYFCSCPYQPFAKLQIIIIFPGQNFLFPGTGREIAKCHGREGKEIWGLYSRESRETGIPGQPCSGDPGGQSWLYLEIPKIIFSSDQLDIWYGNHYIIMIFTKSGSGRILCLVLKKSVVAQLFSQQLESKNVSLGLGGVDLFVSIHIFFILAPSIHISGVNHKRTCLCWRIW